MCNDSVKWVFELENDFSWQSGLSVPEDYAFADKQGVVRLIVRRDGTLTVRKGYAWDGCTPKFCLFDISFGIPDGVVDARTRKPKTYFASLIHDALYQFLPDGLPFSRKQADDCFLRLMTETGFAPRQVYYFAVRLFGGLFARAARKIRKTAGRRVLLHQC